MARYFRTCKQVTVGYGGAGFVTGFLLTLALLRPLYHDTRLVIRKDLHKTRNRLTQGTTTEKYKSAKALTSTISEASVTNFKISKATEKPNVTCKLTKLGLNYRGHVNITREGIICQHWKDAKPHRISHYIRNPLPEGFAMAKNYCRNLDDAPEGLWCYTMNPKVLTFYCHHYK